MRSPDVFFLRNIFLATAAAMLAASSFILYDFPIHAGISWSIGLLTFTVYQFAAFHPVIREGRLSFYRNPSRGMALLTFTCAVAGILLLPLHLFLPVCLSSLLTILYFLQWQKGRFAGGLRSVFLLKNILVALIWTVFTLQIPLWPFQPDIASSIARFFLIFLITVGLDLRDAGADSKLGVMTLPSRFGFRSGKMILLLLCILATVLAFTTVAVGATALGMTFLVLLLVVSLLKESTGYWTYFLLLDGIMILHALFIVVLR